MRVEEEADDHDPGSPSLQEQSGAATPIVAELDALPTESSPQPSLPSSGSIHPLLADAPVPKEGAHPLFSIEQLGVDRRLIVNRKRQLKMYRVWMQGKFRKL